MSNIEERRSEAEKEMKRLIKINELRRKAERREDELTADIEKRDEKIEEN